MEGLNHNLVHNFHVNQTQLSKQVKIDGTLNEEQNNVKATKSRVIVYRGNSRNAGKIQAKLIDDFNQGKIKDGDVIRIKIRGEGEVVATIVNGRVVNCGVFN